MKRILICAALTMGLASTASSHGKATGIVRERMDSMVVLAETMKQLSAMSKSTTALDVAKMKQAAAAIAANSGTNFTSLFPEGSTQHSEATQAVWTKPSEFQSIADELFYLGEQLSDVTQPSELATQLQALSKTCKSCHQTFRQKSE